jgi:hypothetical protein
MGNDASLALVRSTELGENGKERTHRVSKRGRVGEGRPTKRTPEVVAEIAEAVAIGLTDEEAAVLAGVNPDTMTEWRKDPEFSGPRNGYFCAWSVSRLEDKAGKGLPGHWRESTLIGSQGLRS